MLENILELIPSAIFIVAFLASLAFLYVAIKEKSVGLGVVGAVLLLVGIASKVELGKSGISVIVQDRFIQPGEKEAEAATIGGTSSTIDTFLLGSYDCPKNMDKPTGGQYEPVAEHNIDFEDSGGNPIEFKDEPSVLVSLTQFEAQGDGRDPVWTIQTDVRKDGFDLRFLTAYTSSTHNCSINWMALGDRL